MRKNLFALLAVLIIAAGATAQTTKQFAKGTVVKRDVVYARAGNSDLLMDIFIPPSATKVPVVVWIHGGGWRNGSKENAASLWFINRGYAVASINYRLTTEAIFPAQIYDCKAAVRYLRAHADEYKIDGDHIGVAGGSAGGHLVALLGTTNDDKELEGDEGNTNVSSRVQAVCDFYGPTNLLTILNEARTEKQDREFIVAFLGGSLETHQDLAKQASPIFHVSKDASPFLMVHGTADPMVPYSQSVTFDKALRDAGVESQLITVEGGGHGSGEGFHSRETTKAIEDFFDKHLKPAK